MAGEQNEAAGRQLSKGARAKFWIGVVVVSIAVVVAIVATLRWVADDRDERLAELNDRYVEKIEIRSQSRGGGGTQDVIVIDGTVRHDCEEEDGRLQCSDDPQPTEEG